MVNLPRTIRFPFGYVVTVRQLTDAEMKAEQEDPADECDGLWDCETRTIFLRKALSVRRKRYILGHEMGHAFMDWQHECLDEEAMRP